MWLYSPTRLPESYGISARFHIPGVNCERCGPWGGGMLRPFEIPSQLREEIEAIYSNNPSRSVPEWRAYVHRWEVLFAQSCGHEYKLRPGDCFPPVTFHIQGTPSRCFYVDVRGMVISQDVANVLKKESLIGCHLLKLDSLVRYADSFLETEIDDTVDDGSSDCGYIACIVEKHNWDEIVLHKRLGRCSTCGHPTDSSEHLYNEVVSEVAKLREAGFIWREVLLPNSDIFYYQGDFVVSSRAHSVLNQFVDDEFTIKPLTVI